MIKFYCTFGFGQKHENCYCIIYAEDEGKAREQMNLKFDRKWSRIYTSAEEAGVKEFNLTRIE